MRKSRLTAYKGYYHTIIRGVDKQNIFYEEGDKEYFMKLLEKYGKKHHIEYHCYVIMDNHVHILFKDKKNRLSKFMQTICSIYARYFNKKYDRVGHLFGDRFASEIVKDNSQFLTAVRYIIQNPQKAGICKASEYKWSSYNCYKCNQNFINTSFMKSLFNSIEEIYKFLEENNSDECLDIELRPSEKQNQIIDKIKYILQSNSPIIDPSLSKTQILYKIRLLKMHNISSRTIARITGIGRYLVRIA